MADDRILAAGVVSGMPTRIGPRKPVRVFMSQWRDHLNMSQEDVGARIPPDGVSKGTVSRWENAKRVPTINVLAAYAEALGIPIEYLYRQPSEGPSLDAIASKMSPAAREEAIEVITLLARRRA